MTNNTIYLVTTSKRKFEEYSTVINGHGNNLVQYASELIEPQTTDSMAIIKHKLEQAKKLLPGNKVLVDDRGFNIHALGGYPGPMLKFTLQTIGIEGLLRLMAGRKDRRAEFITSLGYYNGLKDAYFTTTEEGFLLDEPRGSNLHGWTELLYIYGDNVLPEQSLAEYTDEQWEAYLKILNEHDVMKHFLQYIG
jgi:XTP/dITP diphosphohydrolase